MSRSKNASGPTETVKIQFRIPVEDMHRLDVAAAIRRKKPANLLSELIRTLPEPPAYPSQARVSAPSV